MKAKTQLNNQKAQNNYVFHEILDLKGKKELSPKEMEITEDLVEIHEIKDKKNSKEEENLNNANYKEEFKIYLEGERIPKNNHKINSQKKTEENLCDECKKKEENKNKIQVLCDESRNEENLNNNELLCNECQQEAYQNNNEVLCDEYQQAENQQNQEILYNECKIEENQTNNEVLCNEYQQEEKKIANEVISNEFQQKENQIGNEALCDECQKGEKDDEKIFNEDQTDENQPINIGYVDAPFLKEELNKKLNEEEKNHLIELLLNHCKSDEELNNHLVITFKVIEDNDKKIIVEEIKKNIENDEQEIRLKNFLNLIE